MSELIPVLVLLVPLAAAIANGLSLFAGDTWLNWRAVQRLTVGATALSFIGALWMFVDVLIDPTPRRIVLFEWLTVGDTVLRMGLLIDLLSALMALMVTGFAFVIGRFSINYMHRETGFTRYFAAYALFVFAMLVLVLGDNYVMLFVGWEAVGVCSYLLIGQYYERSSAAKASTEAFVANRVGDAGFIVGILILLNEFGTVQYAEVMAKLPEMDPTIISAVAFCLLLGAVGKSAQLPLGSWLAKAMEGPTPSSALIHAATMVTAGVYLIVRSQELYNAAPTILLLVAVIGAATALYGAVVGQTVSDIKGLLATSTTTQLGFMFLACGLGAYTVAVFHLLAHAFLKSYLFLTAPSILHHLHGRLDPAAQEAHPEPASVYTVVTLLAGLMVAVPLVMTLIPGVDASLGWGASTWILLAGGVLALFSAGHYAYSLTRKAFVEHGPTHAHAHSHGHAEIHEGQAHADAPAGHVDAESPGASLPTGPVLWPLGLIAVAAIAGIALQVLPGGLDGSWFRSLMAPVLAPVASTTVGGAAALRAGLVLLLVAMVLYAWFTAVFLGRFRAESAVDLRQWRALYVAALNRFWIDQFTRRVIVGNAQRIGMALDRFDTDVLDRIAGMPGQVATAVGRLVTWLDTNARGAVERGPRAAATHIGQFAHQIERHLIGGFESGLRQGSAGLARFGAAFESALAIPAVAVAVIGLVVLAAFFGVGR